MLIRLYFYPRFLFLEQPEHFLFLETLLIDGLIDALIEADFLRGAEISSLKILALPLPTTASLLIALNFSVVFSFTNIPFHNLLVEHATTTFF